MTFKALVAGCLLCLASPSWALDNINDLTIDQTDCDQVKLSWSDVSGDTGYRIRRKAEGASTFSTLADVATNATTYTDTHVDENTTYIYQVRPLLNGTASGISNTPQTTIPECSSSVTPSDINDLAIDDFSCDQVQLSWSDTNGETGYRIRRQIAGGSYVIVADVDANTTSFLDETVTENTSYIYQVRPMVNGVAVAASNNPQITTPTCGSSSSDLALYLQDNSDNDLPLSDYYEVSVKDGASFKTLVTYMSVSNGDVEGARNKAVYDNTISWANFSFNGSVTVRVKVKSGQSKVAYTSATILPSRHGVTTTKINSTTTEFTLTQAGQYSVEFGSEGYNNGLMIFADPMETDVPNKNASNVYYCDPCSLSNLNTIASSYDTVYFSPKKHTIMQWLPQGHIKNIYLEGGSVVKGAIKLNSSANNNTKIWGRGHLDGRVFGLGKYHMVESVNNVSDVWLEGIVVSQPSAFAVRLLGTNNDIHWVKTPGGWRFNNDGLVGYDNTNITNCFVWANDDGIKLYRDNQYVDNIVSWHLTNGGVFQWAWNSVAATNIRVSNVDVLHGMWPTDGSNQGVFNIRGSDNSFGTQLQDDFVFKNIKVETPVKVLFNLAPKTAPHLVKDVTFINVDAQVESAVINRIKGYDSSTKIENVSIQNLKLNGQCIHNNNKESVGNFQIQNATNVTFSCP